MISVLYSSVLERLSGHFPVAGLRNGPTKFENESKGGSWESLNDRNDPYDVCSDFKVLRGAAKSMQCPTTTPDFFSTTT